MPITDSYFKRTPELDFFEMICDEKLGSGMSREVYSCSLDPSVVIKFETTQGRFQNIVEWETWQDVKETDYAKWFAPCVNISSCGSVLIMKRTTPIKNLKRYPERMPAFLGDFKYSNYGMYKGHLCTHDYGRTLLVSEGLTKRTRSVDWWADIDT